MMHFEFLIEDLSSSRAMEILIPKLLGTEITYKIHPYKGSGRIPKNLRPKTGADKRILFKCRPKPERVLFCIAVEEFEAWYLGDLDAIKSAYPRAKDALLRNYINDSICNTWELLADAIHDGGHKALTQRGWYAVGGQKSVWATEIAPRMDVEINKSPSFVKMRDKLRGACGG